MKKLRSTLAWGLIAVATVVTTTTALASTPQQDQKKFQNYFKAKFPDVKFDNFVNGSAAIDAGIRAQWKSIMEFPPYTFALAHGKDLFNQPLADGQHYASCFDHGGTGIRQTYPRFDTATGQVVTLVSAIQACRQKHGDAPLPPNKGDIAAIAAYMASTSDGKRFDIKIPDDPRALAAYENGKRVFYTRRGQLNFSCASCHLHISGKHLRAQTVSPALGMFAAFPVYRSKWGDLGTIDRRISGCFLKVRAQPLPAQSTAYRDLEYFITYMSNGLPVAGPGARP